MKKVLLLMVFVLIFAVGCGKKEETNNYESLMLAQAKKYFELNGKQLYEDLRGDKTNVNLGEYFVTIKELKNASNYGQSFDLTGLEKCSEETTMKMMIDSETLEVSKHEFINKCK